MKYLKNRIRLDEYLVENEYFDNLDIARRNIMAGNVIINEIKKDKTGEIIDISKVKNIRIKQKNCKYVSRGGLKLEKSIQVFNVDFKGKIVLDIGASTGGFTDCALQNGAKFVYAVDVGTNQLDWKLRNDNRIKSIENKHINELELEDIDNMYPDILVMDLSFISIKKVVVNLKKFMKLESVGIFLIKPQFETSKEYLEKGIITDIEEHKRILYDIVKFFEEKEVFLKDLSVSPIRGSKGNIEYLAKFTLEKDLEIDDLSLKNKIAKIVSEEEHGRKQ